MFVNNHILICWFYQPVGGTAQKAPSTLTRPYKRNSTEEISQIRESYQMKNIALLSILGLALLQPAVEAFFLGPIAVGAVIGALAVGKGFSTWLNPISKKISQTTLQVNI